MKKFLIIIISMLYLSTSTGAVIHMHYCMGKLSAWGLWDYDSEKCSKCGMEKNSKKDNDCCKDEHKYIKNTSDQKVTESNLQMIQVMSLAVPVSYFEYVPTYLSSLSEENPCSNDPPVSSVSLNIRNCIFRI